MNTSNYKVFFCIVLFLSSQLSNAQITERVRPQEWNNLIYGGQFADLFLPMPQGHLSSAVWGADSVKPRYVDNGIEDNIRSYWGGNIIKGEDGKYHLFVCGWPESSPKGHMEWPNSTVYHTVCDNSIGPFVIKDTIGKGHNPEAFVLKDGKIVIYVIGGYYWSNNINGTWQYSKFNFDNRDRNIIEGLSNLTFARREDDSYLMVCRGGGAWVSKDGLSDYCQITDKSIYPPVEGEFEDPVVWRDNVQYHLIVNDWLGRIAYYLRSKDGVNWITDPGEAYSIGFARHENGHKEDWFKYERIKILQDEYGRAIQANFAVIDVLKLNDVGNDNHSSKNISIPLNKGLLLNILNKNKINSKTKKVELEIKAEDDFNPNTEINVNSLRFGLSKDVNYGGGWKPISSRKNGKDLIITFETSNTEIPENEFAFKLIGKSDKGKLVHGYARLPKIEYNPSILSTRKPIFETTGNQNKAVFLIENFGIKESSPAKVTLKIGDRIIASGNINKLLPYEKFTLSLPILTIPEKGVQIEISIEEKGKEIVTNSFYI